MSAAIIAASRRSTRAIGINALQHVVRQAVRLNPRSFDYGRQLKPSGIVLLVREGPLRDLEVSGRPRSVCFTRRVCSAPRADINERGRQVRSAARAAIRKKRRSKKALLGAPESPINAVFQPRRLMHLYSGPPMHLWSGVDTPAQTAKPARPCPC